MQRHHHHFVVARDVVGVGDERNFLEEVVRIGKLLGGTDEFLQVLHATLRLDRVLVAKLR